MPEEVNLPDQTSPAVDSDGFFEGSMSTPDSGGETFPGDKQGEELFSGGDPADGPKYKVKYNGKELELPVAELVTNAQKGMNYDHVKSELDALRQQTARSHGLLEQMAKAGGMELDDYLALCAKKLSDHRVEQDIRNGVPEEAARRLQDAEQREAERRMEEADREGYRALARAYPDLKELPESVARAIAEGEHPLTAYRSYELETLKDELSSIKQEQMNRKKTTGSLASSAPMDIDSFMAGFGK